jgi:type IV pilus assembly protein PilE
MNLGPPATPQPAQRCLHLRSPLRGFTIIELMVVVIVVAILSAVAYPSFAESMRKGRRSDAMSALAAVQQAQERWRANNPSYAAASKLTVDPPSGLGQRATSASGHYTIAISGAPDATSYAVIASAVSGGKQDADTKCKVMGIQAQEGRIRYGGGSSAPPDWDDPDKCWAR